MGQGATQLSMLVPLIRRAIAADSAVPEFHNSLGNALLAMGDKEGALDLVQEMLTRPSMAIPAFARFDPTWTELRNEPRFKNLLRHVPPL